MRLQVVFTHLKEIELFENIRVIVTDLLFLFCSEFFKLGFIYVLYGEVKNLLMCSCSPLRPF